ncbi:TRAP transporter small permease [Elioraea sp. Yellowstone]|jgi:TRAP-type C4-dicarboxylate transport system permease small subunit|uniref:TRAP transporter small permease n=1 Tax=Elioraea sp. Yellowstone TaxID=2592070 RepID=UPI00114DC2B7|nr:TRAP transporter small permease [Elioraea sp. Yellowstone]TQF84172.1 TRAP transporter small permease [Elioraea sp. Yellowstone]
MSVLMSAAAAVARFGLWFGGALILLAAILIGLDVFLRKVLVVSIGGADELAGYALAIGVAWGLAAALLDRAHIRIDSLYLLAPIPVRVALDLVGLSLFLGFFALVFWHGIGVFEQSWTSSSRSQSALETPLIVPQALWLIGLGLFVAIAFALVLVVLARLLRGDLAGVSALIGTRSSAEEVAEEMRAAEARIAER